MRTTTEFLPDGPSRDFQVIHLETDLPDSPDYGPMQQVAIANGYLEDTGLLQPFAKALVAEAESHRRPMRVTFHDAPLTGASAYGSSYRTERFAKVVQHSFSGDDPIRFIGHSWGHPQVVAVASERLDQGLPVGAVLGLNPNGLTPVELNPYSVVELAGKGLQEIRLQSGLAARNRAVVSGLGWNAVRHVLARLDRSIAEGWHLLTHSTVEQTASLHERLIAQYGESRQRLIAGAQDQICPSRVMLDNLLAAGFLEEDFDVLDTCHAGPLIDTDHTPRIYRALMLEDRAA